MEGKQKYSSTIILLNTFNINRATIDLEPKIRTAAQDLIL